MIESASGVRGGRSSSQSKDGSMTTLFGTASASSYALVAMPIVAGGLGALTRGEPLSAFLLAGAAIVAVGVYVGALSR